MLDADTKLAAMQSDLAKALRAQKAAEHTRDAAEEARLAAMREAQGAKDTLVQQVRNRHAKP